MCIEKKGTKLKFRKPISWSSIKKPSILFASLFGVAGLAYIAISSAATPTASIEPELASLGTNTSVVNDATASGGSAVKFNAPAVTPPPPTSALTGWQLTTTNIGLAPHGLSCASLPVYSGPSVIASGTTISGKRFTLHIDVSAGNIVIEKSCFKPTSANVALVEGYYPQGDITISDSEFDGSLVPPASLEAACAFAGGANLLRNYIHDVGSGICQVSSTNTRDIGTIPNTILIQNNYVHRLFHYNDAHHEAATIRDFVMSPDNSRTMRWIGNYLHSDGLYISGGLFIQPTFEPIYNVWLNDNVFAGEGWNLVSGDSTTVNVVRNLHVVNNRFKPGVREYYGPVDPGAGPGIVEWTENYMLDLSKTDGKGAIVQL